MVIIGSVKPMIFILFQYSQSNLFTTPTAQPQQQAWGCLWFQISSAKTGKDLFYDENRYNFIYLNWTSLCKYNSIYSHNFFDNSCCRAAVETMTLGLIQFEVAILPAWKIPL